MTTTASDAPTQKREAPKNSVELHRLIGMLNEIAGEPNQTRSLEDIANLTRQLTNAFGIAYLVRDANRNLDIAGNAVSPTNFAQIATHRTHLFRVATLACAERTTQVAKLEAASPLVVFACPVFVSSGPPEAIVGVTNTESDPSRIMASTLLVLQLVAAYVASWRKSDTSEEPQDSNRRLKFIENMATSPATTNYREDVNNLADSIRKFMGCSAVALGVQRRGVCRLVSISGKQTFDPNSSFTRKIESVMDEALLTDLAKTIDDSESTSARVELMKLWNAKKVDAFPIGENEQKGACIIVHDESMQPDDYENLESVLPFIGSRLDLLGKVHRSAGARLLSPAAKKASFLRKPIVILTTLACAAAMLVPTAQRIPCECELQPVKRRYIGVPYEGRLEKALVKPGDVVEQGQTIAVMDGSEVRYQLAGLRAEYDRAQKERQEFLANREISSAQIAALQMERLQHEITIFEQRQANLEIKSPIDGIVISGDPEKVEGARMEKGERLIEVGPIAEMLLSLSIPEDEIRFVEQGDEVSFRLHSSPLKSMKGRLSRVHPRSEQVDDKNVFLGEVLIANDDNSLRPGMSGQAYVIGRRHPLAWNLFHNAWNKAIFALGL